MTQPTSTPGAATATKPKMTDEEIRLECVKLAVQAGVLSTSITKMANSIYSFVKSGAM
jgi:hypothetical protein